MRVAILGAGGIGGYYAGMLARAGHAVHVLARGDNLVAIQRRGLEIHTPDASFSVPVRASDDVLQFSSIELAILSVKTYSLKEMAFSVKVLAENGALLLPLLNGVHTTERLVEYGVPKQGVLGGLTTVSAERIQPGVFERHGNVQQLVLGTFNSVGNNVTNRKRLTDFAEAFQQAGIKTRVSDDIETDLWRKFAFLAPVAAACGLTRSPLGRIRSDALGRTLLERAIREVVDVGKARGICFGDAEVSRILDFCDSLPQTNKPSLLRDLEAGRRTEIDDLSGAVSAMGRSVGIETPIHDTATVAINLGSGTTRGEVPNASTVRSPLGRL